jgi:hypothetical protein
MRELRQRFYQLAALQNFQQFRCRCAAREQELQLR